MVVPASSSRRRRRRAATATASLLTAAAALQLATSTTEAFVTPGSGAACARCAVGSSSSSGSSRRTGSTSAVGPLHARAAAARARALTSSLPPESITCNRAVTAQLANYNSNSVNGGIFNFHPPPLVGSTVVPPTALLSPRRAPSILVPGAASKYGGRASGSPSPTGCAGDDGRASLVNNSSRGSLGFVVVVDDVPSAPSSSSPARTSLAVSRSVPDQADQMDASSFFGGDREDEIEIGIVAAADDAAAASPVRRQVAESLRRNAATSNNSNSKLAAAETSSSSPSSTVPAWFPWIPTRSQIETLKVPELRDACGERGLTKVRYERYNTHRTECWCLTCIANWNMYLTKTVCMLFSSCHFVL